MANISLRQLRYFDVLARLEHFGRAAEACSITQPALSVQIKELESELGATLFERSPRRVRLTGFGEEIRQRVTDILTSVDELGDLARASGDRLTGRLRLGIIPTIAPYLLPRIIDRISRDHSGVELHVRESRTLTLVEELTNGRIDAAIVALPISEPEFEEVALFDEEFVLVRPEASRGDPVPSAETLGRMRLLLLEEGHCFRDQAVSFCNLPSVLSRDGLDASSLSTLVQMVSGGIGVTLIPEMAVDVETNSAPVAIDRFTRAPPTRTIGMVWRKSNPLAPKLRELAVSVLQATTRQDTIMS